jgi:hypothetical protein
VVHRYEKPSGRAFMNLKFKQIERGEEPCKMSGGSVERMRDECAEPLKSIMELAQEPSTRAAAVMPSKRQPSQDEARASKPPAGADLEDSI